MKNPRHDILSALKDSKNTKTFNLFKTNNPLKISGNESTSELNHIEDINTTGEILDLNYTFKGIGNNSCLIDLWDSFEICPLKITEFFKELFLNLLMNKRVIVILQHISPLRPLFVIHFYEL